MTATKRQKSRKIIFGGMFVVSLIIIMVFVSYSWFNTGEKATVTGITMNVAEGEELLIKAVGDNEDPGKILAMDFPEDLVLKSVAGNGIYFYNAKIGFSGESVKNENGVEIFEKEAIGYSSIDLTGTEEDPLAGYKEAGVFVFDFSFYIHKDTPVYIYGANQVSNKGGSSVDPAPAESYPPLATDAAGNVETLPNGETPKPNNISPFGSNIDKGEICAAVRIAILQKNSNGEYELTFVWMPNSTKRLIDDNGVLKVVENGPVEEEYLVLGSCETDDDGTLVIDETTISTNGQESGSVTIDGVVYAWGELTTHKIGDLTASEYCDFRIVVWVDGNDEDCENALLDGLITVNLDFGTTLNEEVSDEENGN